MAIIAVYIAFTIIGYWVGAQCKKRGRIPKHIGIYQNIAILVLVFCMGSGIGANKQIAQSLGTIGLQALVMTIFIMGGSLLAVFAFRKLVGFDRHGVRKAAEKTIASSKQLDAGADVQTGAEEAKGQGMNKLMILIICSVACGILAGYFFLPAWFIGLSGTLISIFLSTLLFFVGIDMGVDGTLIENFKSAGWRIIAIPFVEMVGTFVGAAVCTLLLPISVQDGLCIGAGFAWYSMAPVMLMEYSVAISAMSFMHNVMREVFSILLIPLVARKIGYIESISLTGSVGMDVCLPIIERATSPNIAVYSFITGATISASVPILTGIFMSL